VSASLRRARLFALVLVCAAGSVHAQIDAETETGPNRIGLPGLSSTVVLPAPTGPPLKFGLFFETGTFDAEHGLGVSLDVPDIASRAFRAQLQMRASDRIVLGASLPYRSIAVEGGASYGGLGDADVGASARFFDFDRVRIGGWGRLRIPFGDETQGLGTGKLEGEAGLIATARFYRDGLAPELRWHLNVGMRQNKNEQDGYGDYYTSLLSGDTPRDDPRDEGIFWPSYPSVADQDAGNNDEVLLRTAVEFRRRWGHLYLEYAANWLAWFDDATFEENASWITPGVHLGTADGPSVRAAWRIALHADDPETDYEPRLPDWVLELGVSMPLYFGGKDTDGDGIPDDEDGCPDRPEDLDGSLDDDGCPDLDNDGDGVPDVVDLAPNLPEDLDGFEDDDGRPELDNDLDGIPDTEDGCPLRPEDFDGDRDEDGCPDVVLDRDGDGILDANDACPDLAEDMDGFEDGDGCPEADNDLDGIEDAVDACPDQAEDYDGDRDDDGCPDEPATDAGS